jgi:hypothetical protein
MRVLAALLLGGVVQAAPAAGSAADGTKVVVSFRFTSVSGKRPPNIVEIRRAGTGKLYFDRVPSTDGALVDASRYQGTIVYEADVLTPHPTTEELRFKIVGGSYSQKQDASGAIVVETVRLNIDAVSSTLAACRNAEGSIALKQTPTQRLVAFSVPCDDAPIQDGQTAGVGKNSRIQITITPMCVRTTQSASAKSLCGEADPVLGTWTWKFAPPGETIATHGSVTFSDDGKMSWSGGNSGTWRRSGNSVTLTWTGGDRTVDRLTLSSDGKTLTGSNSAGWSVVGVKR